MILGIGDNADLRTHQICTKRRIRTGNCSLSYTCIFL